MHLIASSDDGDLCKLGPKNIESSIQLLEVRIGNEIKRRITRSGETKIINLRQECLWPLRKSSSDGVRGDGQDEVCFPVT